MTSGRLFLLGVFFSVALSNELLLLTETMEGGRSASRGRVASDQNDDGAILAASSEPQPDSFIFHFSIFF